MRKSRLKLMTNKGSYPSDSEIKNRQEKSRIRKSLSEKEESPKKRLKVVQKKIKKLKEKLNKLKDHIEAYSSSSDEEEEENEKEEKEEEEEAEKVPETEQKSDSAPIDKNTSKEVKEKVQFDVQEHDFFIHLEKVAFRFIVEIDDYFGSLIKFLQDEDIKPLIQNNENFLALTIDKTLLKRWHGEKIDKNDGGSLFPTTRIELLRKTLNNFRHGSLPDEYTMMEWYMDIKDIVEFIVAITKRMLDYGYLFGFKEDLLVLHKKAIIQMRLCNTGMSYDFQLDTKEDTYTTLMQLEIIDYLLKIDLE